MGEPAYIELHFRPNVQLVSVVRRFVSEFYQRVLGDPEGTSRVALATHELLENAVKYSVDGETTMQIEVKHARPTEVTIRMRNRATPEHIGAMREILESMRASADVFAFYQRLMAENARKDTGSGLGLARICAEGDMQLFYEIEGDLVRIHATTQVQGP